METTEHHHHHQAENEGTELPIEDPFSPENKSEFATSSEAIISSSTVALVVISALFVASRQMIQKCSSFFFSKPTD